MKCQSWLGNQTETKISCYFKFDLQPIRGEAVNYILS